MVKGSRLFLGPIIGLSTLCLLALTVLYLSMSALLNDYIFEEIERDVDSVIGSMQRDLQPFSRGSLPQYLDEIQRGNAQYRYTLTGAQGEVIYDSIFGEDELVTLGNLAERPEIESAMLLGLGHSSRLSDSLSVDMMYLAKSFEINGFEGVIRIGRSRDLRG